MKTKKVVEKMTPYEHRINYHLGLTEIRPVKARGKISMAEDIVRDSAWICERAKDYTFSEFYVSILEIARKIGKNEAEKQSILKKLMLLISDEANAISKEVDLIENASRKKIRLGKGCAF